MKTIIKLTIVIAFLTTKVYAADGFLSNLSINKYIKTNFNNSISVNIENASMSPLSTCLVKWQLDNGAINSETVNIGSGGITQGYYVPLTLASPLNIQSTGEYLLKVWISCSGDVNTSNDTLKKNIVAISNYVNNKVLIEELTSPTCSYCPEANTLINNLSSNPNVVVATYHNNGGLCLQEGKTYMQSYFSNQIFTPAAVINMGELGSYTINSQVQN